ncbi:MAG TPA: hypothetical protein VLD40_05790 [Dissulfurispiraceae bacterium]|nr:hypothetical protein [Dissulfurispiraceae bacterium]
MKNREDRAKERFVLTRAVREDLTARGFVIVREQEGPGCESPFPGKSSWIRAIRPHPAEVPRYFACGYVPEPCEYYFEEEECDE